MHASHIKSMHACMCMGILTLLVVRLIDKKDSVVVGCSTHDLKRSQNDCYLNYALLIGKHRASHIEPR